MYVWRVCDVVMYSSGINCAIVYSQEINNFRGNCGSLFLYDWVTIPLVYTQVVPRLYLKLSHKRDYACFVPWLFSSYGRLGLCANCMAGGQSSWVRAWTVPWANAGPVWCRSLLSWPMHLAALYKWTLHLPFLPYPFLVVSTHGLLSVCSQFVASLLGLWCWGIQHCMFAIGIVRSNDILLQNWERNRK